MSMPSGDPDDLIPCPLDPVHMVRRKRMQYHIMKCQQNMDMTRFRKCPFNAQHVILVSEFEDHVQNCEGRAILEREMIYARQQQNPQNRGLLHIPVNSNFVVPESTESWDEDNVKVVIEKREIDQLQTSAPKACLPVTHAEPPKPRLPLTVDTQGTEVFTYSLSKPTASVTPMGRGRGRGRGGSGYSSISPLKPPGLKISPQLPPLAQAPPSQEDPVQAEDHVKKIRKLKKMLRQIHDIEDKVENNKPVTAEQIVKVARKRDVEDMLEKLLTNS